METDIKTESDVVDTINNEGEGESENVSIPKMEWEKTNQTLGSLKKEIKDLRKANEKPKEAETPTTNTKPDEIALLREKLDRQAMRQAGVTDSEDMELARNTAKKWGVDIDEVLGDEDFKVKLERQQTARANVQATSGVKGGAGNSQAKNTPEYWQAKGVPPTPAEVPDRKTRQKIVRSFITGANSQKLSFYNS